MKAVTWQGRRSLSVIEVPDPTIQEPTDVIVRITSTAICGSDLHLYEVLGPYMHKGDVIGHEPMGIVEEVGPEVHRLKKGDRVVVPFNISCGRCYMCNQGLQSQCETTQVKEKGSGAALFGYSELYGSVPGGQAQYLRVPFGDYGRLKSAPTFPTNGICSSPTSCPPHGRQWNTPTSPTAARWRSWGWDRWGSSLPGSASTRASG